MIKANTVIKTKIDGVTKLEGSVLIGVPKQLELVGNTVLTQELYQILSSLNKINPEIILHAMERYMEEVQNEQN